MKTTKPISTISYNTPDYLKLKLEELRRSKKISFWAFVSHKAEEDEKKDHIHLYIEPARLILSDDIQDYLLEPDLINSDRPLGVISFRSSKFSDWYLYASHNDQYLASKSQKRQYHYKRDLFVSSNDDDMDEHIREIDLSELTPIAKMIEAQQHGFTWEQFVRTGRVPIAQINQYQSAWNLLNEPEIAVSRAGRQSHDPMDELIAEDEREIEQGRALNDFYFKQQSKNEKEGD